MWPLSLLRIIKDPERILTDMAALEQKQKLTEHLHMPKTCGHKMPKGRTGVPMESSNQAWCINLHSNATGMGGRYFGISFKLSNWGSKRLSNVL